MSAAGMKRDVRGLPMRTVPSRGSTWAQPTVDRRASDDYDGDDEDDDDIDDDNNDDADDNGNALEEDHPESS